MQVSRWGNSLAIRIPVAVVDALGLKDGDDIEVRIAESRTFEIKKKPGVKDFLVKLRKYRGTLPADFHFDRQDINERS